MVLSTDEEARMPAITRAHGPMMLRGTLTRFRRRCGKPSCRCAAGDPHEGPALTFTEGGRTKTVTLAEAQVAEVAAALARYRQARAELDGAAGAPGRRPAVTAAADGFAASGDRFGAVVSWLDGEEAGRLTHGELEAELGTAGRDLIRQLLQDHLDLRAAREERRTGVTG